MKTDLIWKKEPVDVCGRCGEHPATACGHGVKSETDCGTEYDCDYPWDDSLLHGDPGDCSDCPLCWCQHCKDEAAVSVFALARMENYYRSRQEGLCEETYGKPGLRDPASPCDMFSPGEPTNGGCKGDGHYLCRQCQLLEDE